MDTIEFGCNGIVKLLLSLKMGKSSWPDELPDYVLRNRADVIASYLVILFTKPLEDGAAAEDWKLANIVPIHKSGPRNNRQHL